MGPHPSVTISIQIDFTPNPHPRHTRGRRGKGLQYVPAEGVSELQAEFEVSKSASNMYAAKLQRHAKDIEKLEAAELKQFRLRGFKGHAKRVGSKALPSQDVRVLKTSERFASNAALANKRRVVAKTGGVSKRVLRLNPLIPSASFMRAPARKTPAAVSEKKTVPFDLSKAISDFKRFSKLPSVPIEVVRASAHSGIKASAMRKMIEAMLIRAGVEQNPGPQGGYGSGCTYSGQRIQGEWLVDKHGKRRLICPQCQCFLEAAEHSRGLHPGCVCDSDAELVPTTTVDPEGLVPTGSTSAVHSEVTVPLSDSEGSRSCGISVSSARTYTRYKDKRKQMPILRVAIQEAPLPKKVPVLPVLDGTYASVDDTVNILSRMCGEKVPAEQIKVEQMVLKYKDDSRIVTARNIQEIKQDMVACQFGISREVVPCWRIALSLFISCFALVGVCATSFLGDFDTPKRCIFGLYALLPCGFLPFVFPRRVCHHFRVAYLPHLVASILLDFDRGTSASVVRSNIRAKCLRLSSLPIPDRDVVVFVTGSEIVAEQIMQTTNFFWEGATSFQHA
jgi:hypothetical protein